MPADNFTIKIFTPNGLLLEDISNDVKVPTLEGQINILPNHAKYVGVLSVGVVEYLSHPSREVNKVVVSDGLCSFEDDCVTILADEAVQKDDIDLSSLEDEEKSLASALLNSSQYTVKSAKRLAYLQAQEAVSKNIQ